MRRHPTSQLAGIALLAAVFSCSEPAPAPSPPKALRPVTATDLTGTAGFPVSGGITVHVVDYSDRDVVGLKVGFSVVAGDGSVSQRLVVTDGAGRAHTEWTLGQTAGTNEVIASTFGVDSTTRFAAVGSAGAAAALAINPKVLRIAPTSGGGQITATVVDQFGNPISGGNSFTSRNTAVVTVSSTGSVTAVNPRGASTFIVATSQGFTDSAAVFTLSATDPPCTGITAMAALAIGEVNATGFVDNGICVPASAGEREYAIIPFFDTPVPTALTSITVNGFGVKRTAVITLGALRSRATLESSRDEAFVTAGLALDRRLRVAERREMTGRGPAARDWYARSNASGRVATRAITVPTVGDQVQLNVNSTEFCGAPSMRTGRIAAVTTRAVVIADGANPAGGFTDADFAALGAAFDTLAYPSDVANFGTPTDIDNNARVVLFFTHAVNELGPGVLGFAYARDLLPKSGPLGACPGSNVAEMLYLPVPDASRSISTVTTDVYGTMAHEFQHVLNSARRLYINVDAAPAEELWLNEGLSHIAEELLFYKSTGLAPRQNLGFQLLSTANQQAYLYFLRQNFARYFRFTRFPDAQSPVGSSDVDDDLETRGAIWSFLRFAADQRFGGNEAAFWQSLVNSNSTGIQNLYEHVGVDTRALIRDWAISNFLDDLVPTNAKYAQLSWNLRQVPSFVSPVTFQLTSQTVPSNPALTFTLRALSSAFVRFAVGTDQEAYVNVTGPSGAQLPRTVLLAIVRTK
ncbi:MAG: hypothetical protein ABIR92_03490 [Gemmatimonadaceae bacterium]